MEPKRDLEVLQKSSVYHSWNERSGSHRCDTRVRTCARVEDPGSLTSSVGVGGGNAEQWVAPTALSSTPPEHRGASSWNLQSGRSMWRLELKITTMCVRGERWEAAWSKQVCSRPLSWQPPWYCEQNTCQEQIKRGRVWTHGFRGLSPWRSDSMMELKVCGPDSS